jgi:hypothetical protein
MRSRCSLALLVMSIAVTARADTRPMLTEEAATAAAGTLVLEAGAEVIASEPNFLTGRKRDRWDAPLVRLVYSPAQNVELDLEWVGWVGVRNDPDFGSVSDQGDVSLRAKVRLVDGSQRRATLGARFRVTLPETSFGNGLGPNVLRMAADLLLSQPLGRATLHVNAGLFIHDEVLRPHEQRDFLAYGVAVTHALGSRAEVVGEIAGRAGDGMPGADARSEARAGVRWRAGRVRWDAALRRGLAKADGNWGLTAGLAWTIRPGR